MRHHYLQADRGDRAKAAGAVIAVHLLLGAALLTGLALHIDRKHVDSLATFDVAPPLPLPLPPPVDDRRALPTSSKSAPAGRKADPSPIIAPPSKVPTQQPVVAALVAGTGSASTAGAATTGGGSGAGGSGNGPGGGGDGGGGGRIGAMLINGRLTNRDYRTIAGPDVPSGSAMYVLLVNTDGRVERCRPAASSGSTRIDQSLCAILTQRLRFRPAMERDGRLLYQDVNYVARWGR